LLSVLGSPDSVHTDILQTLLGMNLFVFDEPTGKLKISPDFWIFIAVWLPLTLITGGVYVWVKARTKRGALNRNLGVHKRFRSTSSV
jgi:hypothetical protein